MMTNLKNTYVRMTVLAVVAIATLSTGVGCRELAIRVATIGGTPSSSGSGPEYLASQTGFSGPSSGAPAGGTAQGADGPAAGGCGYQSSNGYFPSSSGPSGSTAPVTPSWAGTSMGW